LKDIKLLFDGIDRIIDGTFQLSSIKFICEFVVHEGVMNISSCLDTKGKGVLSLLRGVTVTGKDGSFGSSTRGNSLIRVDVLVGLIAVEEVRNKFDDTGNTSGTTDQDDFVDIRLDDLGVADDLLNRFKSTTEEILAELFETGAGEGSVKSIPSKR
jgi:hypothetical protein